MWHLSRREADDGPATKATYQEGGREMRKVAHAGQPFSALEWDGGRDREEEKKREVQEDGKRIGEEK